MGEAKNFHLLSLCRYRRLERFRIQLFLTAAAINLKRLVKEKTKKIDCGAMTAVDHVSKCFTPVKSIGFFSLKPSPQIC
jgi:hypothetical protein